MHLMIDELKTELKMLRKGRGVEAKDISNLVGPALRELCGISPKDDISTIRQRLTGRLRDLVKRLPSDLETVVATALALRLETQMPFLGQRVQWLADQQKCDPRTIRRRIDEAIDRLAQAASIEMTSPARKDSDRWSVRRFEAVLRLDMSAPECLERRRIVAEHDDLDEIQVSITLPSGQGNFEDALDLLVEPYYGVALIGKERRAANRFVFRLRLPRTLSAGEEHDYAVLVRIPERQPMRQHYVFVPERRCEEFDLRIRFDPYRRPNLIWRVTEAFHREIDERKPNTNLLTLDRIGEVRLSFDTLLVGYGYGAQWSDN